MTKDMRDNLLDLADKVRSGEYTITRYAVEPYYLERSAIITIKVSSVGFAGAGRIPSEMDLIATEPSVIAPGTPVRDLILDDK